MSDLPPAVRTRVVALAAERLAAMPEEAVPPALRAFRRFTPTKRARLAAGALLAALDEPAFRQSVAMGLEPDPDAGPVAVAATAFLLRSPDWEQAVRHAADADLDRAGAATVDAVVRLTEQLEAVRATGRQQVAVLREQLAAAQAENTALLKRVRQMGSRAAAAERELAQLHARGGPVGAAADPAASPAASPADRRPSAGEPAPSTDDPAEVRRLRARLRVAEDALAAARAGARGERQAGQLRLRVLLDALLGSAAGLRRELALPPLDDERPADAVAGVWTAAPSAPQVPRRGRGEDDPALLDALLAVPGTHLLVDGYNVTLGGWGGLPLNVQRGRLLSGLGALTARTGVEVSVVFDGAAVEGVRAGATPRGVRVLFSRPDEIADDVLRALVAAEPVGRPLVVVSSDREVAESVRAAGASPIASRALVALLERSA